MKLFSLVTPILFSTALLTSNVYGQNAAGQATGAMQSGAAQTRAAGTSALDQASSTAQGSSGASMQDKKFLKLASDGSLFEIKTSQLALQKSQSDDIKQYAQQMIDDHNKLMDQMKPVAAQAGVTPPTDLVSAKHKALYTKLQGLSGSEFDKAYIQAQFKDHQETHNAFQTEETKGTLPAEKDAATQGQPVVDQHLTHIQQIAQAHNVSTGKS